MIKKVQAEIVTVAMAVDQLINRVHRTVWHRDIRDWAPHLPRCGGSASARNPNMQTRAERFWKIIL